MSQAQRVEFYGFGASGAVAADAQHKFFRLLLSAAAYSDPHMQAMSAVTLKPTDVAICISQSGRSKDLLITANVVRESGATLITLCPSQTPLADQIGSASWRERVCQYVEIEVVAGSLKKKKNKKTE